MSAADAAALPIASGDGTLAGVGRLADAPFPCTECGQQFPTETAQSRHCRAFHMPEAALSGDGTAANVGVITTGPVGCLDCRQRFASEIDERLHQKHFHGAGTSWKDCTVQWMLSGETVCTVSLAPNMLVAEVKARVQEICGVPMAQQRILLDGQELQADARVSPAVAAATTGTCLQLVRMVTDPCVTDLAHFRPATISFEKLPHGQFTAVRRITGGINGDVYLYRQTREGREPQKVAVKQLRQERLECLRGTETDERKVHFKIGGRAPTEEDALTEVGVLRYLSKQNDLPLYLLRLEGIFSQGNYAWLVTEFAEGGELFAEVSQQGSLREAQAQTYAWQLLQAVTFLHRHGIGHRDISLENVLLKDGNVRLMDFGMAVRSRTASGTPLRYFRSVGKDFYRAPECYVPVSSEVTVTVPTGAAPGDVVTTTVAEVYHCDVRLPANAQPGQQCKAEVWGYTTDSADVFAVGVCLFIMLVGAPPWRMATLTDDIFCYVRANGLEALLRSWRLPALPARAIELAVAMTALDPCSRPTAAECLASGWLEGLRDTSVALHHCDAEDSEELTRLCALAGA